MHYQQFFSYAFARFANGFEIDDSGDLVGFTFG
jgi:hypothetical protein